MTSPRKKTDFPLVGISSCLTGQRVRYDGRDNFNALVEELIAPYCRLLPYCPESVAGMGIPRPAVNLVQTDIGVRAVGRDIPGLDVTDRLYTAGTIFANTHQRLSGYILQSRSPSCGLGTTPLYSPDQQTIVQTRATGLFAERIQQRFPGLPMLNDTDLTPSTITVFLQQVQARFAALTGIG